MLSQQPLELRIAGLLCSEAEHGDRIVRRKVGTVREETFLEGVVGGGETVRIAGLAGQEGDRFADGFVVQGCGRSLLNVGVEA